MASRMKRIFSRKKHESRSPSPDSELARGNPAFRSSLYDTTTAGMEPQTGQYPIRGQDGSEVLQKAKSRRSSFRSRRSSGSQHRQPHSSVTPDQYRTQRSMDISHPPPNDIPNSDMYPQQPQPSSTPKKRWSRSNLPEAFSSLDIGNEGAPSAAQAVNPYPVPARSNPATQGAERSPIAGSSIRPVTGAPAGQYGSAPSKSPRSRSRPNSQALEPHNGQPEHVDNSRSDHAIPRKQVGPTSTVPSYPATQSSLPKPRKSVKPVPNDVYDSRPSYTADDGAWPMTSADSHGAQAIVERAKTNSVQTHVNESIAPAVIHEVVHQNIHHVREEQITREIHEHDTYHRILPIIDVEVLPPRHFLPVEGGGLVEVPAREVPGRGSNWVIAETASKIASNQPAPTGRREFSARAFPGREGDAMTYITPEGYQKTEQTWVHPPELETGARDTGQSWPMPMGEGMPKKAVPGHKKRSSRKSLDKHKTPLETGAGYGVAH